MKKQIIALAVAAAMGGAWNVSFAEDKPMGERVGDAVDRVLTDKNEGANDASKAPKLPTGITMKENDDIDDVRSSLITIVNRVMTKDSYDDAIGYLANQDRDRINAQLGDTYKTLEAKVEQLRGLFKEKYNEDFDLKSGMLNSVTSIQQGEVQDANAARPHWPLALMAKDGADKADKDRANAGDVDPKFENGRDVAVVALAGKDVKALHLSMQHELPDYWVLDIPNTITAEHVVKTQTDTLQKIIDMKNQWPDEKDAAYQLISFKIIKGFYGDTGADRNVANTPQD